MTKTGLREELAAVYEELCLEPTRDQCTALGSRKHILMAFQELQEKEMEAKYIEDLTVRLEELERRLEASDDASTSFQSAPDIPRRTGPEPH